jgi:hypothetical protein
MVTLVAARDGGIIARCVGGHKGSSRSQSPHQERRTGFRIDKVISFVRHAYDTVHNRVRTSCVLIIRDLVS